MVSGPFVDTDGGRSQVGLRLRIAKERSAPALRHWPQRQCSVSGGMAASEPDSGRSLFHADFSTLSHSLFDRSEGRLARWTRLLMWRYPLARRRGVGRSCAPSVQTVVMRSTGATFERGPGFMVTLHPGAMASRETRPRWASRG